MTVTVTDGATPIPNVRVSLQPADVGLATAYASSGVTDARGVTTIGTMQGSYGKMGIPEGEFIITLEELVEFDVGVTPAQYYALSIPERAKVSAEKAKKRAE